MDMLMHSDFVIVCYGCLKIDIVNIVVTVINVINCKMS